MAAAALGAALLSANDHADAGHNHLHHGTDHPGRDDYPSQTANTALQTAIKANDSTGIATQAAALGSLEQQEVMAQATADAAFYAILTPAQQTTLGNLRMGGLDGRH